MKKVSYICKVDYELIGDERYSVSELTKKNWKIFYKRLGNVKNSSYLCKTK